MINSENCLLIIIDIQEKLVNAAHNGEICALKASKLAKAASLLKIPTIITEQYPKGLGETVGIIKSEITNQAAIIEKTSFSALDESAFKNNFKEYKQKQVILCGIETHICVLQTAYELLKNGYEVYVVKDCTSSRKDYEYQAGLDLLKQYGAKITCLEIVLFELLKTSKHPKFKEIQNLIK